jgi:hypothetical protein
MKLFQSYVISSLILSSAALCARTPSIHVLLLMSETKFHNHTKLQEIFTCLYTRSRREAKCSKMY